MNRTTAEILTLAATLAAAGEDCCTVTVVRTANATSAKAGAKALVTGDGCLHGFVGGACVQGAVIRSAQAALAAGKPRLIRVMPKPDGDERLDGDGVEVHRSSCPSGGTVDLFLEPLRRPMQVVVCGASPVAASLIGLAGQMGYRTASAAVPDDHGALPAADRRIDGFDLSAADIRDTDAVVIATQGKHDRDALAAALTVPAFYVGMVGSRRKILHLRRNLSRTDGAAALDRLRAPAGIAIAAIDPEEIALSILAEIIAVRRQSGPRTTGLCRPDGTAVAG